MTMESDNDVVVNSDTDRQRHKILYKNDKTIHYLFIGSLIQQFSWPSIISKVLGWALQDDWYLIHILEELVLFREIRCTLLRMMGKKLGESGGLEYTIFGLLSSILTGREAPRGEGTLNIFSLVQFSRSVVSLCDRMNRSTPGLPVHHQLPEFTQTRVHRAGDAIQPSHPLSSPSPPAPNPSQHQSLFQWVNSLHEVAKVLEFQL